MKFKSCHDKHTFLIFIGNIYDPNIPARCSLPESDTSAVSSGPVFSCMPKDIFDLRLADPVSVDVGLTGFHVYIIPYPNHSRPPFSILAHSLAI